MTDFIAPDDSKKFTALVVDDDKSMGRRISRILSTKGGFKVTLVTEATIALVKALKNTFDIIVSDIVMPGMTGLDLVKGVRAFNLDIPIILITGSPTVKTAQSAIELGAYRYLIKPFEPDELASVAKEATYAHRIARLKRQAYKLKGHEDMRPGDMAGLSDALDSAIVSLWMAYQPIVKAQSGEIFGYEALLRSDEKRLPFPGAMIEAAENLGRIHELSRAIRNVAPGPMADVDERILLFVNLHPRDLLDERLGAREAPLTQFAHRVILEITERESLDRDIAVIDKLIMLKDLGFRLAIDDLGGGYAGLSSFATLRPAVVKLDISLIFDIDISEVKRKVVQAIVDACHSLDILVVAEGIETEAEKKTCIEIGCDLLQGYLIAKPGKSFPKVNWTSRI